MKTLTALLAALGLMSQAAFAQVSTSSPTGTSTDLSSGATNGMRSGSGTDAGMPETAVLQPKTQGDVTYLCGGVGTEEVAYMKTQAKDYDMMLTFATRKGDYLADVNVNIADAKGNSVLQTNCDGPIMLVELPRSGTYHVHADTAGYQQDHTIKVSTGRSARVATAVMSWPQQVAETPATGETATGSSGTPQGVTGSGAGGSSGTSDTSGGEAGTNSNTSSGTR